MILLKEGLLACNGVVHIFQTVLLSSNWINGLNDVYQMKYPQLSSLQQSMKKQLETISH